MPVSTKKTTKKGSSVKGKGATKKEKPPKSLKIISLKMDETGNLESRPGYPPLPKEMQEAAKKMFAEIQEEKKRAFTSLVVLATAMHQLLNFLVADAKCGEALRGEAITLLRTSVDAFCTMHGTIREDLPKLTGLSLSDFPSQETIKFLKYFGQTGRASLRKQAGLSEEN